MVTTVAVLAIGALLWTAFVWSLVDLARRPSAAFAATGVSKRVTALLIVVSGGFGGIYYLLRARPKVARAASRPRPNANATSARHEYRQWVRSGRDPWP